MEPIKIKPRIIKPVKIDAQPISLADGVPYVPLKVETKEDAMRACLHMILKHSADMFLTITEIVAEEYKLDSTEMINTIRSSPRFEKLCADDVLLTLGYFEPKVTEPKVTEPKAVEPKETVKQKRKPRAPAPAPAPAPEPVAPVPAPEPIVAPKKPKIRIVNKANK